MNLQITPRCDHCTYAYLLRLDNNLADAFSGGAKLSRELHQGDAVGASRLGLRSGCRRASICSTSSGRNRNGAAASTPSLLALGGRAMPLGWRSRLQLMLLLQTLLDGNSE
jgi:hypothetical protein